MKLLMFSKHGLSLQLERARRSARTLAIVSAFSEGDPVNDIASEYECHRGTVSRIAKLFGLVRERGIYPTKTKKAAVSYYRRGKSLKWIAKKTGMKQSYISILAKQAGLQRKRKLTDKQRKLAVKLYMATPIIPIKKICAQVKTDRRTLWKIVKEAGKPLRIKSHRSARHVKARRASRT